MIAYFDTSFLVKLYAAEDDSETARAMMSAASAIVSSVVSYAELCSALARKRREGGMDETSYRAALRAFQSDWQGIGKTQITEDTARWAGELAGKHALRGSDAIHLASALCLSSGIKGGKLMFATADDRLARAATLEGLVTRRDYDDTPHGGTTTMEKRPKGYKPVSRSRKARR